MFGARQPLFSKILFPIYICLSADFCAANYYSWPAGLQVYAITVIFSKCIVRMLLIYLPVIIYPPQ